MEVKKKMSNQEQKTVDFKTTPNYDQVCKKMRKLLGSAVLFIPDACEGLREDWYPELSQEQIKNDNQARRSIREKIFNDWSNERSNKGVWSDVRVQVCFPDWLRDPGKQTQDYLETSVAAMIAGNKKFRSQMIESQEQKPVVEELVEKLPDPVVIPDIEDDVNEATDEDYERIKYGTVVASPTGEKQLPYPLDTYEDAVRSAEKLWMALTNKKNLITSDTVDVLIDHIKPTRDYRLRVWKGIDSGRVRHLQMVLLWLDQLIQDTLRQSREIGREDKQEVTR